MKLKNIFIYFVFLILLSKVGTGTIPTMISEQVIIKDTSNNAITGRYNYTLEIYDNNPAGTLMHTENQTLTTNADGIVGIEMYVDLPFDKPYWLEITFNDTAMSPRVNLTSVPYCYRANISDFPWVTSGSDIYYSFGDVEVFNNLNVTGRFNASGVLYVDGTNVGIGTTKPAYLLETARTGNAVNLSGRLYINDATGMVGINTNSPAKALHIKYGDILLSNNYALRAKESGGTIRAIFYMKSTNIVQVGTGSNDFQIVASSTPELYVSTNDRVGINTITPTHPLTVVGNVTTVSIWSDGNISASGYITRTSKFDKKKNPWNYVKDADYYLTDGKIDPKKFYGFTSYKTTDFSRPIIKELCYETINGTVCENIIKYPYNKTEYGISLEKEIDVLRQAVYELKQENDLIKQELCRKDPTYIWCFKWKK